jgi:hypothetical protein
MAEAIRKASEEASLSPVMAEIMASREASLSAVLEGLRRTSEPVEGKSLALATALMLSQLWHEGRAGMRRSVVRAEQRPGSHDREMVITRATEVIGDEQAALRWLGTPVRALDYATPISRLNDAEGQAAVLNVLTQLEHGVL